MDSENNVKKHENDNGTAHGHEKKNKKTQMLWLSPIIGPDE